MDPVRVDTFIATKGDYFEPEVLPIIRDKLLLMDDQRAEIAIMQDYMSPLALLIVSVVGGTLGIDRFLLGDVLWGVIKLITGGVCGILWIYDLFVISGKTKRKNFERFCRIAG